jgi:hypothetical protein
MKCRRHLCPPLIWFAPDSLLEGDGFEPSVPRQGSRGRERGRRPRRSRPRSMELINEICVVQTKAAAPFCASHTRQQQFDNFWDRLLGTYRNPDADDAENPTPDYWAEGREGSNALYGLFRRLLARPS